ncbi:MAG TPA: chlorite dismutase family protein [Gemmatimonadaceae bacterium]|nr:chlorite dismutase family protein [Gemmatimonadaceae bacterium]
MTETSKTAHAPETIEGWYALHQIFRRASGAPAGEGDQEALAGIDIGSINRRLSDGWSAVCSLIGSVDSVMVVHFRKSLEEIEEAQKISEFFRRANLLLSYSFLSVTEAGLYHITAQLAADAVLRGGVIGDAEYKSKVAERVDAEVATDHIQRRLFPELPHNMPYVCFYPMSKRRAPGQNWYTLSLEERSRLMTAHGLTGRRYAGRVQQIITGAIGFESWEWGVTLFARDPLDFKKLITDMRFDEVSARYAEFGEFYVGKVVTG